MIIGGCPYCDASQCNPYQGSGVFQRIECDECHRVYWLRHSNFDPEAFTEADFLERYEVDSETKKITDKAAEREKFARAKNPEIWKLIDAKMEEASKQLAQNLADHLLYGATFVGSRN